MDQNPASSCSTVPQRLPKQEVIEEILGEAKTEFGVQLEKIKGLIESEKEERKKIKMGDPSAQCTTAGKMCISLTCSPGRDAQALTHQFRVFLSPG